MSSGCLPLPDSNPPWSMSIYLVDDAQTEDSIDTRFQVALGGSPPEDVLVENVTICALDESGTVVRTVPVGDVSEDRRSINVTMNLDQPPEKVVLGYDRIHTLGAEYSVLSLNRTDEGLYRTFAQDGPQCNSRNNNSR